MLIGVDIIDIERLKEVASRTPRFLQRVFTAQELEYCMKKKNPYPSLAARFAAKEAIRKLDEIFVTGVRFHDVEVIIEKTGKPAIVLHGEVAVNAIDNGICDLNVSLSHSREQAVAVVCANRR